MDDIKNWLYLLAGLVIFIVNMTKNKKKVSENRPGQSSEGVPSRRPKSFEELLQEFSSDREEVEEKAKTLQSDWEERPKPHESHKNTSLAGEGKSGSRRFSDEESRQVYQNSIQQAEGFDLDFERDDDYRNVRSKSTMKREIDETANGNGVTSDILKLLKNPQEAKKAVILSEILNRKY